MAHFTKADVQYHGLGYGSTMVPAVNVKVYAQPGPKDWAQLYREEEDRRFDAEWVDAQLTDEQRGYWWSEACQRGWEQIQNDVAADTLFRRPVEVYSEGRSSGWAYVDYPRNYPGRTGHVFTREDVQGWDAVAIARWGKFARYCRETVADVPFQYLWLLYHNVYLPWREEEDLRLAKAAAVMRLSL